ncbi:MAG: hypothetical protein LBP68_01485, partial [Acidobacteriota bacterium]|nr:hypothetical protein [Acidobacteriota bacterium]
GAICQGFDVSAFPRAVACRKEISFCPAYPVEKNRHKKYYENIRKLARQLLNHSWAGSSLW